MNATAENIMAKDELVEKCAIYLNKNFHKFSQGNKIKISLEIFKRTMPTKVEGNLTIQLSESLNEARNRLNSYANAITN